MSTSRDKRDAPDTPSDHSSVVLMLGDIGSTTWRMFLPTIGLAFVGKLADDFVGITSPWLMLLGAGVGMYIAWVLVKRQLKNIHD